MKRIFLIISLACLGLAASAAGKMSYYFQRAEEAYGQEDYETCLNYCRQGVEDNKKDGYCWAVMAEIYSKAAYGRFAEALEAADNALASLKKNDTWWVAFVHAIRGDVYYKIADYPASKEAYRKSLSIKPDNNTVIASYADVCATMGEWQPAAEEYKKLLKNNPAMAFVYAELADCEYHLGQIKEAKTDCNMAIYLSDDENIKSHIVLSKIALDEHNLPLAAKEMVRAMFLEKGYEIMGDTLVGLCPELMTAAVINEVEKAPNDFDVNNTAALYFFQTADFVTCLYYLEKAYELQEQPELNIYKATCYQQLDMFQEAQQCYLKVLEADSLVASVYNSIGVLQHTIGKDEEAVLSYKRAISLEPDNNEYYRMCARSLINIDLDEALHYMDTAVMLSPEDEIVTSLFNRAEILRIAGKESDALKDLNDALAYKNTVGEDEMVYVYALLGEREKVTAFADSVAQSHNTAKHYEVELALIYAAMRDKQGTLKWIRRAFDTWSRSTALFRSHHRLRFLADDNDFITLLSYGDSLRLKEIERLERTMLKAENVVGATEIPFTRQGGVCQVKCAVNGLPFYFVFDTGAADVTLSCVEADYMLKNGYLTDADFMGKQNYVTADGNIHEGTIVNLREVRVGDIVLHNIKASVVRNQNAPLLLGQSVFRRFGTVQLDNSRSVIRFVSDGE